MATDSQESIFTAGLTLQGRYRLDEAIALGGMAEVWHGYDLVLEREVAIKLLHPHLASDQSISDRFKREAIAAARLSHPNVVPTFDAGADQGVFYIVLGLIVGPTLGEIIEGKRVLASQAIEVARQIAEALDHAHSQGIIHRDIKPSNILIVDGGSRIMVADFGLAKAVAEAANESLTLPGLTVGTSGYVAPEQANGHETDGRVDIYALGVVIHEMICGHLSAETPTEITQIGDLSFPTDGNCNRIPPPLDTIVLRATAIDPDDRYATAADLRDDLIRAESQVRPANMSLDNAHDHPPASFASGSGAAKAAADGTTNDDRPFDLTSEQPALRPMKARYEPMPSRHARRRHILTAIALATMISIALLLGLTIHYLAVSGPDEPSAAKRPLLNPNITLGGATSFDPFADKVENPDSADNATDNDPETSWSTSTYSSRNFGNLKPGVGLILHVNAGRKFGHIEIDSPTSGWAASIYVANNSPATIGGWGRQVAGGRDFAAGTTTLDLNGTSGNSVLIWITDLGPADKVTIDDVRIKS